MSTTSQPTDTKQCCGMKFTIHLCISKGFYYIKSGCGIPFHNNHPKIMKNETCQSTRNASQRTMMLRDQLLNANAPNFITRQVITRESGLSSTRAFYDKSFQTPNDVGRTSADRLLNYLSTQYDGKYVALFDVKATRNLQTVRS